VSFTDATIARLPSPIRPYFERHHELIKFAIVGATTFVIDSTVFFTLKLTVLEPKPVTAKIIAGVVAVIASYILNREWSFRDRGGRERHHEALMFFAFSGVGVLLSMAPLWFSSYVLMLRVPEVSLTSRPTSSATCCRWPSASGRSGAGCSPTSSVATRTRR
jgi:putative flippase GtrA